MGVDCYTFFEVSEFETHNGCTEMWHNILLTTRLATMLVALLLYISRIRE